MTTPEADDPGFKDVSGGVGANTSVRTEDGAWNNWTWKQIMAAVLGNGGNGQGVDTSVSDPQSLYNAANSLLLVQRTLEMVGKSISDQAEALAGGDDAPWRGAAAEAFNSRMQYVSDIVDSKADVLRGGDSGLSNVPAQVVDSGNKLQTAIDTIRAIDSHYANQALIRGAPQDANGLVRVSSDPEVVAMMTRDMRTVLSNLAQNYQITIDKAVPPPPDVPPGTNNTNGGGGGGGQGDGALAAALRALGGQGPGSGLPAVNPFKPPPVDGFEPPPGTGSGPPPGTGSTPPPVSAFSMPPGTGSGGLTPPTSLTGGPTGGGPGSGGALPPVTPFGGSFGASGPGGLSSLLNGGTAGPAGAGLPGSGTGIPPVTPFGGTGPGGATGPGARGLGPTGLPLPTPGQTGTGRGAVPPVTPFGDAAAPSGLGRGVPAPDLPGVTSFRPATGGSGVSAPALPGLGNERGGGVPGVTPFGSTAPGGAVAADLDGRSAAVPGVAPFGSAAAAGPGGMPMMPPPGAGASPANQGAQRSDASGLLKAVPFGTAADDLAAAGPGTLEEPSVTAPGRVGESLTGLPEPTGLPGLPELDGVVERAAGAGVTAPAPVAFGGVSAPGAAADGLGGLAAQPAAVVTSAAGAGGMGGMPAMPPPMAGAAPATGRDARPDSFGLLASSSAPWSADAVVTDPDAGAPAGTGRLDGVTDPAAAPVVPVLPVVPAAPVAPGATPPDARRPTGRDLLTHRRATGGAGLPGPDAGAVAEGSETASVPAPVATAGAVATSTSDASAWDVPRPDVLVWFGTAGGRPRREDRDDEPGTTVPVAPADDEPGASTGFSTWRPLRPGEARPIVREPQLGSSGAEPDPEPEDDDPPADEADDEEEAERTAADLLVRDAAQWGGPSRQPGVLE